jgi:hypothetical protein
MTRKKQILRMIAKLDEDVSYDRVIYHLTVMRKIEGGLKQAERGEGIDHDELFDRLLAENGKDKDKLDSPSTGAASKNRNAHRAQVPKNRNGVRSPTRKRRSTT